MRIGIRCDAGGDYGLGHISRMNSLTKALKILEPHCEITFYSKTSALWMSQLSPTMADVVKFNEGDSEMHILERISLLGEDVLIIDRKDQYDNMQLRRLRKAEHPLRVVCIDMPWARPEECDLLVLPNIHTSGNTVDQLCGLFGDRFLYGAEYVLIRDDVLDTKPISYKRRENWIAFFAGGSDPTDTLKLMYNMSETLTARLPNVQRLYCIGEYARSFEITPGDSNAWVTGYHHLNLAQCALAVSLFGVTAYEALYLRTPVLTAGHNKVNEVASQYLEKASEGASIHMGDISNMMREDFCDLIYNIWCDLDRRKEMYMRSSDLICSTGAGNIAEEILNLCPDRSQRLAQS